ncbi:nitric oxide synthase, brain-like isoform X2 [Actinia tenebrosa]|uniref:nitric-oxide synthase (NADPH) n=1 Tax=Actinia tenebrosa TaxID=6105 RepID=A0A6P8HCQ2_ACTTE|nr:nitric oxide synthase, brain-like isoform X2 [Actinia tenebrosa]
MFDAIIKHIKYGTNKGNIRSTITVFPQRKEPKKDFRVWNGQLITYAGYRQQDGSIIGDPANAELTEICISMGWEPKGGQFDVLPLVLQAGGEEPEMFEIPPELVLEVKLKHPKYPWFEEMGLKWYVLPAISSISLDVGGLEFPACPFNGWYMETEIAARDLGDPSRYNLLEPVAKKMGLDTKSNASLWKDLACIEMNVAVLHSFQEANVTITDHHSASESFMKHFENENKLRGGCPGDWVWIVPPVSGSSTPVFHQELLNYSLKPSYEYQDDPWKHYRIKRKESDLPMKKIAFKEVAKAVKFSAKLMGNAMAKRTKAIILYATETGKSENYAKMLSEMFLHAFDPKVMCMNDYPHPELENEQLVLIVTSTFGNGDPPENGESFARYLYELRHPTNEKTENNKMAAQISSLLIQKEKEKGLNMKDDELRLASLRYSVFGLGSRAYPNFCAFAKSVDKIIQELGGEQVYKMGEGDELCGQEEAFKTWAKNVFKAACETFCVGKDVNIEEADASLNTLSRGWSPDKYRFTKSKEKLQDVCTNLSVSHNKTIIPTKIMSVKNLQSPDSSRATLLVRLDTSNNEDFKYKPGDHLSLFPANKESVVQSLLDRLCQAPDPDQPITVEASREMSGPFGTTKKWEKLGRFPVPITLREAFSRHIDITGTPAPQILNYLSTQATDPDEKKLLEELGKGDTSYENWKYDKQANIVEVLEEFPSLKVNAELLLTQLPLLQPRFYSISSSQDLYPGEIHVTVAVVRFTKRGGRGPVHHGVCSTWLESLVPNDIVPCFVRHAPSFHLPQDDSVPLIMVGPGTGIAPFRSFWQQRQFDMTNKPTPQGSWGDMFLYFGCRSSRQDDIYRDETANAKHNKVLANVRTALSREEDQPKQYVQDLLKEDALEVIDTLISRRGHFYTCGDVSMAADVCRTLQTMLESYAAMSQQESQDFIDKLKSSGRYHEDIFGVTLRTREVTDRVRTAARKAWVYIATARSVKGKIRSSVSSPKRYPLDRGPTVTVLMRSEKEINEENEAENIKLEARNQRRSSLPDTE